MTGRACDCLCHAQVLIVIAQPCRECRHEHRHKHLATTARITFRNPTHPHPNPRSTPPMAQLIPSGTTATADVAFFDAAGNAASVDGAPTWSSSDEAVATIEASADGLSAVVTGVAAGIAQAQLSADARLGSGTSTITGIADIEVVSAEAVTAVISFRAPEAPVGPGAPSEPPPA